MQKGHDIVCLGLISWQNDYTKSTMKLLTELAATNRVLYVNFAYSVKDIWQHLRRQKQIPIRQILGLSNRITRHELGNGQVVYVLIPPPVLPINQLRPGWLYSGLLRWNAHWLRRSIRQSMRQLDFSRPIVLNALYPIMGSQLAGKLTEKALVYYCYDAIEAESWSRWHGPVAETELLRRADAVITSSQGLYELKRQLQPKCYLVENGVDVTLFEEANVDRTLRPTKTIGYIGAIDNRLDLALLERCFTELPAATFLLVGRIDPAIQQRFSRLPTW